MSSPFDAPTITQGEADNRYISFVQPQTLTPGQQAQALSALGIVDGIVPGSGANITVVTVDTDPDGSTVLVITTP